MATRAKLAPFRVGLGLTVALFLVAACGQSDDPTVATPGSQAGKVAGPWDRTFLSTSVTENGQPRPLVEGTRIRLDFRSASGETGDSLGGSVGCNSMGGPAEIKDDTLIVGDLATTEMGCEPDRMEQDTWLAGFLTSEPAFALAGDDLTLTSGTTEIKLQDREVADPDRPLQGTRWVVDGIVSGDSVSSVPGGGSGGTADGGRAEAFFTIGEDEAFGGNTGCNTMGGKVVEPDPGTLAFSEVITTKMACEDDRAALERAVLDVLDGEVEYEIDADRLRLTHPSGKGLHLRETEK